MKITKITKEYYEQGETLLKGEIGNLFLCKNCREKNDGFFSKLGLF
jgi:hypothetical protein